MRARQQLRETKQLLPCHWRGGVVIERERDREQKGREEKGGVLFITASRQSKASLVCILILEPDVQVRRTPTGTSARRPPKSSASGRDINLLSATCASSDCRAE
ncbi:hypothetical protein EVAR_66863_1 [Eumeta japonica]|uniref:Uncharacterized protein n=1 Tax=Eumeta variegata TaxID=151549 RepID=A0A4C1ZSF9_EUMVA|nr:hypothetical protein EVAR_66863_1 [Eumeta japonica]